MPRERVRPPGKKPYPEYGLDSAGAIKLMRSKLNMLDRKDYQRTIAGRGDTHALDGGRIPASKTKRGEQFKRAMANAPTQPIQQPTPPVSENKNVNKFARAFTKTFGPTNLIPVWEDRDVSNRGTKLNP